MRSAVLAFLVASSASCRVPPPNTKPAGLVDCAAKAVRDHALSLLPLVNDCLVGGGFAGCLIGLINPAAGITTDVVGCVVRGAGSSHAASAQANPRDAVARDSADHARSFLQRRGYRFVE